MEQQLVNTHPRSPVPSPGTKHHELAAVETAAQGKCTLLNNGCKNNIWRFHRYING